ncbi:MAG: ABC transporter substrate-binding protein [Deltaproteobacteria bacterium]|nr:ABC transporter substrate-binding protein [Deltaproteobacteria bacterium]
MRRGLWVALLSALFLGLAFTPSFSQEKVIYYANPMDYTQAYHYASPEWFNGAADYAALVNLRGGIKGHRLVVLTADHGNEPQRGIELYERYKQQGALMFNFYNTPCVAAVLPRVLKDKIILLTPVHGRSDAADGETFPYVFIPTPTYWTQAAAQIEYIYNREGKSLKGKKIGYNYLDTPWGREALPVFEKLSKDLGFELQKYPYPPPGTEQTTAWTQIRRNRPDWVIMWGIRVVSVPQAIRVGYPLDKTLADGWFNENELDKIGHEQAKGCLSAQLVAPGKDFPVIQAIIKEVYGAGKGKGDPSKVGTLYFNQGVYGSILVEQAARIALEKFGEPLTGDKLKNALETLKDFDPLGLAPPITFTAANHEGGRGVRIAQWDGTKWVALTPYFDTMFHPLVRQIIKEEAAKFKAQTK